MITVRQYKNRIKSKIKLYYDNGNFDYGTVMNIIENVYSESKLVITHPERKKK